MIAGTDCGMGNRVHPQIGWAKLKALGEGAELAYEAAVRVGANPTPCRLPVGGEGNSGKCWTLSCGRDV